MISQVAPADRPQRRGQRGRRLAVATLVGAALAAPLVQSPRSWGSQAWVPRRVPQIHLASAPRGAEVLFPNRHGTRSIVSFVSLRAHQPSDSASRGQIAILKSLRHQTKLAALQIVVVAYAGPGQPPSASVLTNALYDWGLGEIPLLSDRSATAARAYRVTHAPTTFLVAADGRILHRWDGFAAPGSLILTVKGAPRN